MKKYLLSGLLLIPVLALVFSFSLPARAEQGNNNDNYPFNQNELRANIDLKGKLGNNMGPKMAEFRKKLKDRIEIGVKTRVEHNFSLYEAMYNRLTKIADRIDSRIDKLEANGVDVSVSVKYLAAARSDLSKASASIRELNAAWNDVMNLDEDNSVDNSAFERCKNANGTIFKTFPAKCQLDGQTYVDLSVSTHTPVSSADGRFAKIRTIAAEAKGHLKDARQNMIEAVKNMNHGDNENHSSKVELDAEAKAKVDR